MARSHESKLPWIVIALFICCSIDTVLGSLFSLRRLQSLDPGEGTLAVSPPEGTLEAIQGKFDHYMLHSTNRGAKLPRGRSGDSYSPCAATRGSFCKDYYRQDRVPWKPGPRGSKDCPRTQWGLCNGVGNCNYDIGICQCPAGWKGDACDQPDKRPCSNAHKGEDQPLDLVLSHIGPDGMDLDLSKSGWSASRCGGFCDEDRASCWCPANTTFGRKPPPPGSPPWVRFSQRGRAILEPCKPGLVWGKSGAMVTNEWGNKGLSTDALWGEQSWCNSNTTTAVPPIAMALCGGFRGCQDDGLHGPLCDITIEETCINQCSGHGECDSGFCRCHPGWYGEECARKKAGEEMEPGLEDARPWLKSVIMPVPAAAQQPPVGASAGPGIALAEAPLGRMRPLIYIYDMPPEFNSRMLQYKNIQGHCGYRQFIIGNTTDLFSDNYSLEMYLHEMLAISPHRTFDPEEADFFYVPVYYTCWMWPINGWADMPFWGAPTSWHRYSNAAHLWLKAKLWIQAHFPYWDRRNGRDHIWLTNHDEGACYMPSDIYRTSIMLTHWGRMDPNHISNTAYGPDNYSAGITWKGVLQGKNVKTLYEGHPCYDPHKDLVVPGLKLPSHFSSSPLLGSWPRKRDILLYLRGDVGKHRLPNYSRGLRQKLYSLATTNRWAEKYRIFVGDKVEVPGSYGEHLSRSVFCAVVPGDGFSMRFEDAVLHGCLPLILMDGVHAVFESVVDLDAFSLRLTEKAVNDHLPQTLTAISPDQIERMQRRLAQVWHRFTYSHGPLVHAAIRETQQNNELYNSKVQKKMPEGLNQIPAEHPFLPVRNIPVHNDALATIIQWLHSRILDTR